MSFFQAMTAQPTWVQLWLLWMAFGAFLLPLSLFLWREMRITACIIVLTHTLNGMAVAYLFNMLGYVKLLGLPHLIFWGPLVWYLIRQLQSQNIPAWPARIFVVVIATLTISLAFDLTDTIRYILGERAPWPVNL